MVEYTQCGIGDIGEITMLQSRYYDEHWNTGKAYECLISGDLAALYKRYDPECDWGVFLRHEGKLVGSIFVDSGKEPGNVWLRYYWLDESLHGKGIGKKLFADAMEFAEKQKPKKICLWTQEGLVPAVSLYRKHGFVVAEEKTDTVWGVELNRLRMEKTL